MKRRDFLKNSGLIGLGTLMTQFPVWSRTVFAWDQPIHNIPENKNIDTSWIKSLYERGEPVQYRKSKNELRYLGMPVGGLHTGTVYVGGDGRLWLWQVYNDSYDGMREGVEPKNVMWNDGKEQVRVRPRDGAAYIEPAIADNLRVLEQGFAISVTADGTTKTKELRKSHWDEILFEPTYPTCTITYTSADFPVDVVLTVYSPFIPLDTKSSSLPLTTLHLDIRSKVSKPLQTTISGWMENGVFKNRKDYSAVRKIAVASKLKQGKVILFTCTNMPDADKLAGDYGSMGISCLQDDALATANAKSWPLIPDNLTTESMTADDGFDQLQVGVLTVKRTIAPKQNITLSYAVSWHFNNPHPKLRERLADAKEGYWYGKHFIDALAVLAYYQENRTQLDDGTLAWQRTWNDSSLPHWFLDRTFVNIGTLATANTMRFGTGRFWGWEGIGACAGTCTHVWQYGQSMGRVFPELEKNLREVTDLGIAFKPDSGAIIFRAEYEGRPAIDGQAGVVLRFYRDHQMSTDATFLKRNWPDLKKAIQFIIDQDQNGDGMTDKPMENTLDAVWEGEIAWIVGLCLAAVRAGQELANEAGDSDFEKHCAAYVQKGSKNMDSELFNGEYYIHRPGKESGRKKLGSYNTCHIDQVYGQAWTFQVGLPRINSKEKTLSALKSLWKYNFTTDVGPYIKTHLRGRPYAVSGDGGMIMNTNPKNEAKAYGDNETWQLGYFHECMSGFEHQVAAHMMAEGMSDESLILTRAIHDRYHGAKRNPFNEIECSDHYARAMASYGTFLTACGYYYHGPQQRIGFSPKIGKENFKSAFTTAEGWGSYLQEVKGGRWKLALEVAYGRVGLQHFILPEKSIHDLDAKKVQVQLNGSSLSVAKCVATERGPELSFKEPVQIKKGDTFTITWKA